jgi:hypothetical protein
LLLPDSPGFTARSSACSTVSVVSTQKAIGRFSASATRPTPSVTPWHTYSKCGVSPLTTTPIATSAS